MKIRKNWTDWLFDPKIDGIRIVQFFRNPDDFIHGSWDLEEIESIGEVIKYLVTGKDPRTGNRGKCMIVERDKRYVDSHHRH